MTIDLLRRLEVERAVTRGIIEFARAMDRHDWDGLRELMTPEVTGELGAGPLSGPDEIISLIASFLERCGPSQHLIGNVLVDVADDGRTATSRAYVQDLHLGRGAHSDLTFSTLGDYEDDWVERDGRWLLLRRVKGHRGIVGSMKVFERDGA